MAGSYDHVKSGWSLIENMGDAYEAVEELYYLVRCLCDEQEIRQALEEFYRFKRGEANPFDKVSSVDAALYGAAYLETQEVMDR